MILSDADIMVCVLTVLAFWWSRRNDGKENICKSAYIKYIGYLVLVFSIIVNFSYQYLSAKFGNSGSDFNELMAYDTNVILETC